MRRLLAAAVLSVAVSPVSAEVWGIKSNAPMSGLPSDAPAYLFRFLENGGGLTGVGPITVNGVEVDADALAMGSLDSMYAYVVSPNGSQLAKLDPATAAATLIGPFHPARDIRGATLLANGQLLVVDSASDELLMVDPSTGALVGAPVPLDIDVDNGVDIAWRPDTGVFYLNRHTISSAELYTVNITSGVTSLVFADAAFDLWNPSFPVFYPGIAFSLDAPSARLFAYEANGSEDIYYYDLPSGTRNPLYHNFLPSFNAGRGDLASPVPEPASVVGAVLGAMWWISRRKRT
ncbi:MAG: PEP-CTERM sorting domain-containing protein [Tepidisphaerales bacterium]